VRGSGTLLLSDDSLVFEMWIPRKELIIAYSSIIGMETPRSFLGKTNFRTLLQVNFTNAQGESDAAAWLSCCGLHPERRCS